MAIDIHNLYNVTSGAIRDTAEHSTSGVSPIKDTSSAFESVFNAAVDNLNVTNSYLSDAENEELKLAMGLTNNTHDLTIALQKASTALQYTVAVRDKFLEAYKELMQMQL
ncbi:MAG: flagellar hook-basal body complex protein FliE [Lachnospiraceae bacterium]|nr:flagellar hook-basal body complex protein FliE [Lachnospiraceae bacterium]